MLGKHGREEEGVKDPKRRRGERERGRESTELEMPERRLQSLARVLQGSSECVAIARVGDMVLIASNDLKKLKRKSSQEHSTVTLINQVMAYFSRYYKGDVIIDNEERVNVISDAFDRQARSSFRQFPQIDEAMRRLIIKQVIKGEEITENLLKEQYGSRMLEAQMLLPFARSFYRDFQKVEGSSKPGGELAYLFEVEYKILRESSKEGVHAEAQILEHIIKEKLYDKVRTSEDLIFGVSKLCCSHCYEMIGAANEEFRGQDIETVIKIPGRHDLDFTWPVPELFDDGYHHKPDESSQTSVPERDISEQMAFAIGQKTSQRVDELFRQNRPTGISQRHSFSSSEPGEEAQRAVLEAYRSGLESHRSFLQQLPHDYSVEQSLALIENGLLLLNSTTYCRIRFGGDRASLSSDIGLVFSDIITTDLGITDEEQRQSIKDCLTHTVIVGEELAASFQSLFQKFSDPAATHSSPFFRAAE